MTWGERDYTRPADGVMELRCPRWGLIAAERCLHAECTCAIGVSPDVVPDINHARLDASRQDNYAKGHTCSLCGREACKRDVCSECETAAVKTLECAWCGIEFKSGAGPKHKHNARLCSQRCIDRYAEHGRTGHAPDDDLYQMWGRSP